MGTVGQQPARCSRAFRPDRSYTTSSRCCGPAAAGLRSISFTESIAAARAFAKPGEPRQPGAEPGVAALGVASDLAGGLFGAMPAGGGTTQTASESPRRRTEPDGGIGRTAAVAVATLLLLAPLIAWMPHAVLAAVVVAYSVELISPAEFRVIARVRRTEVYWAVIAFVGVALLGTLKGILVAVIASLLALGQQTYDPPVYALGRERGTMSSGRCRRNTRTTEDLAGLAEYCAPRGGSSFANAQRIGDTRWPLIEQAKRSVILLDCSAVFVMGYTAPKMLAEAEARLRAMATVWLAGLNPDVLTVVKRSKLGATLGRDRMFFNRQTAVEHFERTMSSNSVDQPNAGAAGAITEDAFTEDRR